MDMDGKNFLYVSWAKIYPYPCLIAEILYCMNMSHADIFRHRRVRLSHFPQKKIFTDTLEPTEKICVMVIEVTHHRIGVRFCTRFIRPMV